MSRSSEYFHFERSYLLLLRAACWFFTASDLVDGQLTFILIQEIGMKCVYVKFCRDVMVLPLILYILFFYIFKIKGITMVSSVRW